MRLEHTNYPRLTQYSGAKTRDGLHMPIMLTGSAGTSKSMAAEHLAEDLGLRYGYIAGSQQLTKSDLLGYRAPSGDIVDSIVGDYYQNGGLLVIEEIDAINANILLNLNTAIAGRNGYFAGRMVKRHENFRLIATANTYGGSNENYNARTKLDASTMSRFLRLEWELDEGLETNLLGDMYLDTSIKKTREMMKTRGYELSMRDVLSYQSLINIGIHHHEAAYSTLLREVEGVERKDYHDCLEVKRPSKEPIKMGKSTQKGVWEDWMLGT